ncbi:hypothetical protein TCAL_05644 [Tigriopus californicus]|uniref:Uncharacterized protein n=1 Tax=Tigriopus californicus TaxID=6832 RepID=A0A553NUS2_TIGCA|nr:hypothetical protein TCAL_05644 [Tigriopus californicus]|eukprot:TCALIF_05644-PA protein Name:"Similar to IFT140 Intraflagellar transport protein 140 homolog (Homo sapiens)" AED:0.02 eAED:0.02 QI:10/0/0/1/0/0/2/0/1370
MSLFVDKVITPNESAIQVGMAWHPQFGLLALGSYSEDQGGVITIVDHTGFETESGRIPPHPTAQSSCLSWHPLKKLLVIGWDTGELYIYVNSQCLKVDALHNGPIHLAKWSSHGSSLITTDKNGSIIGWKSDGNAHLEMLFHHELKDEFTGLIFCPSHGHDQDLNEGGVGLSLTGLARAAVAGDEKALDLFSSWRPDLSRRAPTKPIENLNAYAGSGNGIIYSLNENGSCMEVLQADGAVKELLVMGSVLIIVTETMVIGQFQIEKDGSVTELSRVKLSSRMKENQICWVSSTQLAISSGETSLRVWNLKSDDNFVVSFEPTSNASEFITCLDFCPSKSILSAGTSAGNLIMWQLQSNTFGVVETNSRMLPISYIGNSIRSIQWGMSGGGKVLALSTIRQVFFLNEQDRAMAFSGGVSAVQISPTDVAVNFHNQDDPGKLTSNHPIERMYLTEAHIVLYGGGKIVTFEIQKDIKHMMSVGNFNVFCDEIAAHDQSIFTLETDRVFVRSFQGTIKQTLIMTEEEGTATTISVGSVILNGSIDNRNENSQPSALALRSQVKGRGIVSHAWDEREDHFLVCQTRPLLSENGEDEADKYVSLFFHEEHGLIVHDIFEAASARSSQLVGVDVPFVYVYNDHKVQEKEKGKEKDKDSKKSSVTSNVVEQVLLKDFEGLDASDKPTRDAVVKFCFNLSIGNMDEAFRAIKVINNKKVWGNLARMCVKSQRLDVATICLGKMEHSIGARAMRKMIQSKKSSDVKVATLAIYLNMPEEAERILFSSEQYELLNKFYQDSGKWQKALELADNYDRIHLRKTYYNYAKHLESKHDIDGAIAYYEKSGTSRFEVPRLLFEDWAALEAYVDKSDDKALKRWLAQYLESTGEMEMALQFYELAEDYLSLVRVHCYCENLEKASEIANSSGDRAACYHLARQFENMDDIQSAIHFFTKAQAYSNAIRICKEQGYDDHIWNLALLASPNEKLDAAKHFEKSNRPMYDRAVILYEKAGYFGKALDLAIQTNQHNTLQGITKHLSQHTDPLLLSKAANFFLENKQYDKAVDLFVVSHQVQQALDLCLQYNINITNEMAEKLAQTTEGGEADPAVLNKLAEVCYRQGNYHLATKKWTQAGNRLQAMKALLKSGDTEKIIYFANVSRDRDIYILAGNYLQTLDWRNNGNIMKNIIAFYQKSKAYDLLGWFYQACADVEIDEYQNYEKALGALSECVASLQKHGSSMELADKTTAVLRNMELIQKFVDCQQHYPDHPTEAMQVCRDLLQEEEINAAVRKGDIYGFMIEHFAKTQDYRSAQQMIEELRRSIPNVNLAYYVNSDVLLTIEKSLGVSLLPDSASTKRGANSNANYVEDGNEDGYQDGGDSVLSD